MLSDLDLKKIGGRIAYIRLLNNQTQEQFAEIIGISKGHVSEWENHKYEPSFYPLVRIVQNYSIEPTWLLVGQGEMTHIDTDSSLSSPPDISMEIALKLIEKYTDEIKKWNAENAKLKAQLRFMKESMDREKPPSGLEERRTLWRCFKKVAT